MIQSKKWKRLMASVMAVGFVVVGSLQYADYLSAANVTGDVELAYGEDEVDLRSYATGGIYSPPDDSMEETEVIQSDIEAQSVVTSFDVTTDSSTARYFPEIGRQGEINSCSAWATTYYQFTYEVNKFRGITTTPSNSYSPTWTYNYINKGSNIGTTLSAAYRILENQGAMTLADMPYYEDLSTYSFAWPTNIKKMLNALHYRAKSSTIITPSSSSAYMTRIKQKIASGHVAVVHTDAYGWLIKTNADGEKFVVRGSSGNGGHFVTVVGYDDDIQITVNGTTLTGAFKIANSWGDSWGNDGYIWVAYDALNSTSAYDTGWDDEYTSDRQSVFSGGVFNFITPYQCSAEFCECVRFTSKYPWSISLWGNKGTTASTNKWRSSVFNSTSTASTRYLVFDYGSLGGSFVRSAILSSQWTMQMTGNTSSMSTYNIQSRIVDSLNQEIEAFDSVYGTMTSGEYTKTHEVSLAVGRISSYDDEEITNEDISLLQNYLLGNAVLSSLQYKLADYNDDGLVNGNDLAAMRQYVAAANGRSISFNECVNDLMEVVSDELDENGVTFDAFMSGELAMDTVDIAA
ncbi:MAG: C1 family peptidase [Ruminococcus sp.]